MHPSTAILRPVRLSSLPSYVTTRRSSYTLPADLVPKKKLNTLTELVAAADEVARRKLGALKGLPAPVARRRLAAFLDRRGFGPDIILATCRRYVSGVNESD